MRARWVLMLGLLLLMLVPASAAQAGGLRVRIAPQYEEVALAPSQRGGVTLDVRLEVRTACTSGTRFGVGIIFGEGFPAWAGASPEPMTLDYGAQGGRASARLELYPSEDAPPGQSVRYVLHPEVRLPPQGNCTSSMEVDGSDAFVTLRILRPGQTGQDLETRPAGDGGSAPVSLILAGLGLVGLLRRRR